MLFWIESNRIIIVRDSEGRVQINCLKNPEETLVIIDTMTQVSNLQCIPL